MIGLQAALLTAGLGSDVGAQTPPGTSGLREPVYRVPAQQPPAQPVPEVARQPQGPVHVPAAVPEHPLMPAIRIAQQGLARMDRDIKDYSCTLVKKENIEGVVGEHEHMFVKIRHQPFSVYLYFLAPGNVKGRECIYVAGQNENKLVAHEGGGKLKSSLPTVKLDPLGMMAMRNQRYPITEIGARNLTVRLLEVAEQDAKFGECDVQFFQGAKIDGRQCTCIQVTHPTPRRNFRFHIARVFIDDELQFPIRFESYDWPARPGTQPILLEEYTYRNVKVNNGFTDADFDSNNQQYNF